MTPELDKWLDQFLPEEPAACPWCISHEPHGFSFSQEPLVDITCHCCNRSVGPFPTIKSAVIAHNQYLKHDINWLIGVLKRKGFNFIEIGYLDGIYYCDAYKTNLEDSIEKRGKTLHEAVYAALEEVMKREEGK